MKSGSKGSLKLIHIDEPKHTIRNSLKKARAVLKHRPGIILFEYPMRGKGPEVVFNRYSPKKKPWKKWAAWKTFFGRKELVKTHPWLKGDSRILENIEKLWKEDQQALLYLIDAPVELTSQMVWASRDRDLWPCWVTNFLREQYMIGNFDYVEKKHQEAGDLKILVFIANWHWENIKFLRRNPPKREIWERYFKQFKELTPRNIEGKIKEKNRILLKYWGRLSLW